MRICFAGDEEESYEFQLQEQECTKLMGMQEEHVAPATKVDKTLCVNESTVHETRGSMRTSFWDRLAPHFPQVRVLKAACALMTCIMCVRISYVSFAYAYHAWYMSVRISHIITVPTRISYIS
jgi:hypothetical protein